MSDHVYGGDVVAGAVVPDRHLRAVPEGVEVVEAHADREPAAGAGDAVAAKPGRQHAPLALDVELRVHAAGLQAGRRAIAPHVIRTGVDHAGVVVAAGDARADRVGHVPGSAGRVAGADRHRVRAVVGRGAGTLPHLVVG